MREPESFTRGRWLGAVAIASTLALSAGRARADDGASTEPTFEVEVSATGSGCPAGSWRYTATPIGGRYGEVIISFSAFQSHTDTPRRETKACQLSVRFDGMHSHTLSEWTIVGRDHPNQTQWDISTAWHDGVKRDQFAQRSNGHYTDGADLHTHDPMLSAPCGAAQTLDLDASVSSGSDWFVADSGVYEVRLFIVRSTCSGPASPNTGGTTPSATLSHRETTP